MDHDLWGDDDKMYGGVGDGTKRQAFFAGDGDDLIVMGDNWAYGRAYGYTGDDTIYLGDGITTVNFAGGEGNDKIYGTPFDEVVTPATNEVGFGNAGNDLIYGSHKVITGSFIGGGPGDDKIIGGDENIAPTSLVG